MMKKVLITLFLCIGHLIIWSQDNLESLLEKAIEDPIQYTTATFKNTRILNGHSIENIRPNELEFRISHRFGQLNSGAYELWGLDQANIHFSLDYGPTRWLNVGVGRGTYQKSFDGFVKLKLLRQSKGKRKMPISLSYLSTISINSLDQNELNEYFSNRLAYVHALLIARKFSDKLSLQLSPHIVHRNYVESSLDQNDIYSIGIGGRYKLTNRVTINMEYFYNVDPPNHFPTKSYYNTFSIGFDIETGGHVFQLHITNSLSMIEKGFIGETRNSWSDGGVHFGFNISRIFTL